MSITGAAEVYGLQNALTRKEIEVEKLRAEIERLRARNKGIAAALKRQSLFAFEHLDGTFTINMR